MEHRQRSPCHAGTLPAGTVAPGSVPASATRHRNGEQIPTAHDMHRDAPGAADRTASADRRPEQQRTTRRRPGLFLLPCLHACHLPGLPDQQPGARWVLCRRRHDDHASAPPPQQITPPTCTACQQQTGTGTSAAPMTPQPISCTACPLPAHLHRQTSQQQPAASAHRLHPSATAHPAALPPACRSRSAPPTTAKRPKTSPPRPAAGGVRFFTYPAYRLCSIAVS